MTLTPRTFLAVVLLALLSGDAVSEAVLNDGVAVEVRVVKSGLRPSSRDVFELTLRNASRDSVTVYGNLRRGLLLEIRDRQGREAVPVANFEELGPPPPTALTDFVVLQSGHALSLLDERSLADLGVNGAGEYAVRVGYWHVVREARGRPYVALASEPRWSAVTKFSVGDGK